MHIHFKEKYLKEHGFIVNMTSKEFQWLEKHYKELSEKFPGKIVAIVDSRLVGVGDTIAEAEEQAQRITAVPPLFGRIRKKRAMIL